jgi:hypothetical protein
MILTRELSLVLFYFKATARGKQSSWSGNQQPILIEPILKEEGDLFA